jgi:GrpB-like predicted nucleotidyltransferase (UPF0157 family)
MLIKKYTTNWIKDFNDLKAELEKGLIGIQLTIEHIGSTAVANLDAKPIIDIDIVYTIQSDYKKIQFALEQIGYYHNGNQGIEKREVFKRHNQPTNKILDSIRHHLYVCPMDSKALERHILTRNHLQKNENARLQYQQMKYEIAEKANQDSKLYAALKELTVNPFIDTILELEKRSIVY